MGFLQPPLGPSPCGQWCAATGTPSCYTPALHEVQRLEADGALAGSPILRIYISMHAIQFSACIPADDQILPSRAKVKKPLSTLRHSRSRQNVEGCRVKKVDVETNTRKLCPAKCIRHSTMPGEKSQEFPPLLRRQTTHANCEQSSIGQYLC